MAMYLTATQWCRDHDVKLIDIFRTCFTYLTERGTMEIKSFNEI